MGVQLNIKSIEARLLAEELAAETGDSITQVVTQALRRERDAIRQEKSSMPDAQRQRDLDFHRLIAGSRGRWRGAAPSLDHGDLLYDELGLPR